MMRHTPLFAFTGGLLIAGLSGCGGAEPPNAERAPTSAAHDSAQPATEPGPTKAKAASLAVDEGRLPAEVLAVRASQPGEVVTSEDSAEPYFYYARVWIDADAQRKALELLGYRLVEQPYFDDYRPEDFGKAIPDEPNHPGRWMYTIATGGQVNTLLRLKPLLGATEVNPKPKGAQSYPLLTSMLVEHGSGQLSGQKLLDAGFMPAEPTLDTQSLRAVCDGSQTRGLGGFLKAVGGGVVAFLSALGELFGEGFGLLLELAKAGSDWARSQLNHAYCKLKGSYAYSGKVLLHTEGYPTQPGMHLQVRARGGLGGLLLREAETDDGGRYSLKPLCNGLDYQIKLSYDSPAATISDSLTALPASDRVVKHINQAPKDGIFTLQTEKAQWQLGAQIGRAHAQAKLGYTPDPPLITVGTISNKLVGGTNNQRTVATCGALSMLGPLALAPFGAALAAGVPALRSDIFAMEKVVSPTSPHKWPLGVMVHEYGHYVTCQSIKRRDSIRFHQFKAEYALKVVGHGASANQKAMPSTLEALADVFSYEAVGYTDYFQNDPHGGQPHRCPTGKSCMEPDSQSYWPKDETNYRAKIKARAGVMTDWLDKGSEDPIQIDMATLLEAVGEAAPKITTKGLAARLTGNLPGEAAAHCQVLTAHGMACDGDFWARDRLPPSELVAEALDTERIRWSWKRGGDALGYQYLSLKPLGPITGIGSLPPFSEAQTDYVQSVDPKFGTYALRGQVRAAKLHTTTLSDFEQSNTVEACVLPKAPPTPSLDVAEGKVRVKANLSQAGQIRLMKSVNGSAYFEVARTDAFLGELELVDPLAAPGATLSYRLDAVNCHHQTASSAPAQISPSQLTGLELSSIYVRAGATGGDGSKAKPFGTIGEATALLGPTQPRILVAGGLYPERIGLPAEQGYVGVYGGYSSDFSTRDSYTHKTIVIGDTNPQTIHLPGHSTEFPRRLRPLVSGQDYLVDGVEFDASLRTNVDDKGKSPTSLDLALGGDVTLRNVRYVASDKLKSQPGLGWFQGLATHPAHVVADKLKLVDSYLHCATPQPGADKSPCIVANEVALTQSTILGEVDARAVIANDWITAEGSVVRAGIASWYGTTNNNIAVYSPNGGLIINSILTGRYAAWGDVQLVHSATRGQVFGYRPSALNSVLTNAHDPAIFLGGSSKTSVVMSSPSPLYGMRLVHNLFAVDGGSRLVLTTWDKHHNQSIGASFSDLADVPRIFGSNANKVWGNLEVGQIGDISQSLLDPSHTGPGLFAPDAGSSVLGAGIQAQVFGYQVPEDIRRQPRSSLTPSIGPYEAPLARELVSLKQCMVAANEPCA